MMFLPMKKALKFHAPGPVRAHMMLDDQIPALGLRMLMTT
jgi:hypothetical protein